MQKEQFSNRWGIVLASLGMAIGAGNLWRFPRLAGQYGGAFLILWVLFLLIWSIPILMAEFAIGKRFKKGTIGSYGGQVGKGLTWGGFFITLCTLGIAFYYSVVTGWALQYLGLSLSEVYHTITGAGTIADKLVADPSYLENFWSTVANGNILTVVLYILAVIGGITLLAKGIQNGLEKANRILIPTLFALLLLIACISLSMDNGVAGLEYMFAIDVDLFHQPTIWIEALSQSAWSTGAGWGLIMTISSYSRSKEDVTLNTFIGAFGNNTASLMAGIAILPAVFALSHSNAEAESFLQSGNQALMFTVIPKLFSSFSGGAFLSVFFFFAFFLAAFSSLLPMLELFICNLTDLGMARKNAITKVAVFCIVFGFPSAWSLDIFTNQDWVWGVGLIISGFFILIAVVKYGASRFKRELIDSDSDFIIPTYYFVICTGLNLVLTVVLIYWWLSRGYSSNPWFNENGYWNVFDIYSNASVITQWLAVIAAGIVLNGILYKKMVRS